MAVSGSDVTRKLNRSERALPPARFCLEQHALGVPFVNTTGDERELVADVVYGRVVHSLGRSEGGRQECSGEAQPVVVQLPDRRR